MGSHLFISMAVCHQLDDDFQIFISEMVGNHHFHPLKTGGLWGTR